MVCHVDDRGLVGSGVIADVDGIVGGERVGDVCRYVSREVVVAVGRVDGQHDGAVVALAGFVHLILPSRGTSVQAVSEVVRRQLDKRAVDCYLSLVDAVGVASDGCPEVAWNVLVVCDAVESQHHVGHCAVLVGNHNRNDAASEIGDAHFHAVMVFQCIESDRLCPVDGCFKLGGVQS